MKKPLSIVLLVLLLVVLVKQIAQYRASVAEFEKHESLVRDAVECMDQGHWLCAEKNIRELLQESPEDTNLQMHLAGILFEQERYDECVSYIDALKFSNEDTQYLKKKSISLKKEMENLGVEKSMHFRVEFEGQLSKKDVMEALAVLEVAYDSLCHLFDFRPENKMHLVLYKSNAYQGVGERPDWVAAVYDGKLRVPVELMQYREVYRPILFHELTHGFVRAMTRSKVPLWLNEGIAQIVDGSHQDSHKPEGPVPSLQALTELFVKESKTSEALKLYWYSMQMVEHLLLKKSSTLALADFKTLRMCVEDFKELGVDESLKRHYGTTSEELYSEIK